MTQKGPLLYLELETKLISLNDRFELSDLPNKNESKTFITFLHHKSFFFFKKVSVF